MPQFLAGLFALLLLYVPALPVQAQERVTLQLKHSHQFQFAGYYAALEKGYYRDAGLDVQLLEGSDGNEPERAVLDGRAQYGVGSSSLLLARLFLARLTAACPGFSTTAVSITARGSRASA